MRILGSVVVVLLLVAGPGAAATVSGKRVTVEHNLPDASYAEAIAKIVDFTVARSVELGYDMPARFSVRIDLRPEGRPGLSTTGDERIHLTLGSVSQLLAPRKCGVFHVYGFAHEVGHCCMYRIIKERAWMSTAAAEGWATYYGYRIDDLLDREYGEKLWPDPHDYAADRGLKKCLRRLRKAKEGTARGAFLWSEFVDLVGEDEVAGIFRAIEDAKIDPFNAVEEVGAVLGKQKHGKKLEKWWKEAAPVMVVDLAKSDFETDTVKRSKLARKAETLTRDEGEPTGSQSWPGDSGAAVRFSVDGDDFYLTGVNVYGQRYGRRTDAKFTVWLLDEKFKPIRRYDIPYDDFDFGPPHWEEIEVEPTRLPRKFMVAVVYHAEATMGVYRFHDGAASGESFTGVPGEDARPYGKGDWLIRAVVARKK